MICCKITADFGKGGDLLRLIDRLSPSGDMYFRGKALYFADVAGKADERSVRRALKGAGYKSFFVEEFTRDNPPSEGDDEIASWLTSKLIRMNYNACEERSQRAFRGISKGLDLLDAELDAMIEEKDREVA